MKKRILCFFTAAILMMCIFSIAAFAVGDVIDFTRDSVSLYPQQSYQLTLKTGTDISEYKSSDPEIVSVNDTGMLKAMKTGSSIITATDKKGNQATCTVTVRTGKSPESVVLETQSLEMNEGDTHALVADVLPADIEDTRLFFYSSDTDVAKVDKNGFIKAIKTGVSVITVESASAAVSAKCMVKVNSQQGHSNFNVSISGVLYSIAGDKKANMVVELKGDTVQPRTTTDPNGRFYFDSVVQGNYTLNVYKNLQSKKPVASGNFSVNGHDMNMSCIINNSEVVILSQRNTGTENVKDITLEKTNITLEAGTSYDMSFKVKPSDAVLPTMTGISEDPKIAMVDIDGRITGMNEGTTTITFSTSDGKISKSCKVIVVSSTRNTYSWIIIILESTIIVLLISMFAISYRRFLRNKERAEGLLPPAKKRGKRAK